MLRWLPWMVIAMIALGFVWLRAGGAGGADLVSEAIEVDGKRRVYYLYRPRSAPASGTALVLVLHGGEGNATRIARQTGFNAVADAHGFVVVYPESLGHWNDGRATTAGSADDVGFMRALIGTLTSESGVDARRVYVTGASNGGMMTLRLACEASDVIAAFAPVMASFPASYRCGARGPVAVLMINGTDDKLIRWQGGTIPKGRRLGVGGEVVPVPDTLAYWQTHNRCAASRVRELPDTDERDGTRVHREDYQRCDAGAALSLLRIEGGGHTWPGSPVQPRGRLAGRVSRDVNASELIWQFFSDKRLGGAASAEAAPDQQQANIMGRPTAPVDLEDR